MNNPNHTPLGFLPLKGAAAWAGVSVRSLKRWIDQGLPYYQPYPRGRVLVKLSDIQDFLTPKQVVKPDLDRVVKTLLEDLGKG